MAGPNLEQILGLPRLTKLIQETTTGLPQEKILGERLPGVLSSTEDVIGNSALATLTKGQRKVMKRVSYNSPPISANLETIGQRPFIFASAAEVVTLDPNTVQNLRAWDSFEYQEKGAAEVGRQIGLFKQKAMNNRLVYAIQALVRGNVYFDSSDNVLPTSSGADSTKTISLGISANNQNQLNGIITIPWSNPVANIPKDIETIRQQAAFLTGYIPEVVIYGKNIPSYLAANQYVLPYSQRFERARSEYLLQYALPDGYMGIKKWIPGAQFFYEDANGTNQQLVPDDAFIFFPEPEKSWWRFFQGSNYVPKNLNIMTDMNQALDNLDRVFGMFSYARLSMNPISVELVMGDTFLPAPVNPDVLWQATVAGF